MKRVFLIILDSFGIGALPDASVYGDEGTNTLASVFSTGKLSVPNMRNLGLFSLDGLPPEIKSLANEQVDGSFARVAEVSKGKDTTIGHWEIAGVISKKAFPTYPNGFPESVLKKIFNKTKRKVICNKPYSGTEVIKYYGLQHIKTGDLIIYTSADSVLQIAAHEDIIPLSELYEICKKVIEIVIKENLVSRVIARPFIGNFPNFTRTKNRKDFSVPPPYPTMLDALKENGLDVISVGKISDIFAGRGITKEIKTKSNREGIEALKECLEKSFNGLCFVNLVDFDMLYGHRNNADGYALALNFFDEKLGELLPKLKNEDILIITADHGCDPGNFKTTDHTREYVPLLIYGTNIKKGINLGTLNSFSCINATALDYFNIQSTLSGSSFLREVLSC